MGFSRGPKVVTDGLVLALDAANVKSFRGEPTTNFFGNSFRNFTGTSYSPDGEWPGTTVTKTFFPNLVTPIGPGATLMTESTSSGIQGLTRYGGGSESGAHSLSAFIYPLTSNITEFTIGLLGDSANMIYFNLVTGDITYGGGISNRNAILEPVPLYPGWFRIGANFEGRSGGWVGSIGFSMQNGYAGSGVLRSMYITGIQYEFKTYPTPFTESTRGATVATGGGWVDRSGNNNHGELVNGTSFNSANFGSLVFDGVDDRVTTNLTQNFTNELTVETWYKGTKSSRNHLWNFYGSNLHCNFNDSGRTLWMYWEGGGGNAIRFTSPNFTDGTIKHLVFRHSGNVNQIFLNGQLLTPQEILGTQTFTGVGGGGYDLAQTGPFEGNIYYNRVYSKALTAEEILQNFNATKSRYGL
jgi:hypothetical protein